MSLNNYYVIDTECSGALRNHAHPFDPRNKLLFVGMCRNSTPVLWDIDYDQSVYGDKVQSIREELEYGRYLLGGFNLKFDLHWLSRYRIFNPRTNRSPVWDCQLAHFIYTNQQEIMPSLSSALSYWGLPTKKDTLKEYIDKGIDVDQIPKDELADYLRQDLLVTESLMLCQQEAMKPYWPLFRLQCEDLLVLQDMEFNGMKYDLLSSLAAAEASREEEAKIISTLNDIVGNSDVNWASNDHLSVILYGGKISVKKNEYIGQYKTGQRAGQDKYGWKEVIYEFPQLVKPIKGSELKKKGYYATDEKTLKSLKAGKTVKEIISLVLRLTELQKLRGTYLQGIPKKFEELNWEDSYVHGQINQVVARTARTSSSNPNLQNNPEAVKEFFVTRYKE